MASSIKDSFLRVAQGDEYITLVNDFGIEQHLSIPLTDSANRQAVIDAALADMDAYVATVKAYATDHGLSLPGAE